MLMAMETVAMETAKKGRPKELPICASLRVLDGE